MQHEKLTQKVYLTAKEVAELYSIPDQTLANWRSKDYGPPFVKMRHRVLYKVKDLENWLDARTIKTRP